MRKKVLGIFVCMLLIATALPAVGTMNEKEKPLLFISHGFNAEVHEDYAETNHNGVVLWDNGMHYHGAIISQWDPLGSNEATGADDFQFEETTVVTDVHWMSAYAVYDDLDFDWNISFYQDRGDGNAPGAKIYEQVFPNAMVHETFIEEIEEWGSWMFSYWVDLPDAITFTGGEKYWISIQGVGDGFPLTYWGDHWPTVLHELVWKSPYWGYLEWTTSSEIWDISVDYCFQLTGDGEPVVSDLECEGDLIWDEVSPGTVVNSTITIMNNGDVGSMLRWEVDSVPDWGTNWTLNWTKIDHNGNPFVCSTDYGYVGTTTPEEIIVEVTAPDKKNKNFEGEIKLVNSDDASDTCSINVILKTPRSRAFNTFPLFLQFLEQHPHLFPIIRHMLGI